MENPNTDGSADAIRGLLVRIVPVFWALALCVICVRVSVQEKHKQSGFGTYYRAGERWRLREHVYSHPDDHAREHPPPERLAPGRMNIAWGGFRYPLTSAILFSPLSYLPLPVGEVLWRVMLVALFLGAIRWCLRAGFPSRSAADDWPLLLLLLLWPFAGALNNGQSTCIVISCMLAAMAAVLRGRWLLCAACVTVASVLKIYPLASGLLLIATYPRQFTPRFVPLLALAIALPFLLRPDHWTIEEHRRWLWHLFNDALPADNIRAWDLDIRILIARWFGLRLTPGMYLLLEAVSGAAIAALLLAGQRRGWPQRLLLAHMLALSCCWMTLLGPATEPSTYVLVAPSLAFGLLDALRNRSATLARTSRFMLCGAYAMFLGSYMALWFPWGHRANSYGIETMGALLLMACILLQCVRDLRGRTNDEAGTMKDERQMVGNR